MGVERCREAVKRLSKWGIVRLKPTMGGLVYLEFRSVEGSWWVSEFVWFHLVSWKGVDGLAAKNPQTGCQIWGWH